MRICDSRDLVQSAWDNLDWRLHVGFLGHGNIPHIWNAEKECWLPVTEVDDCLPTWRCRPVDVAKPLPRRRLKATVSANIRQQYLPKNSVRRHAGAVFLHQAADAGLATTRAEVAALGDLAQEDGAIGGHHAPAPRTAGAPELIDAPAL